MDKILEETKDLAEKLKTNFKAYRNGLDNPCCPVCGIDPDKLIEAVNKAYGEGFNDGTEAVDTTRHE